MRGNIWLAVSLAMGLGVVAPRFSLAQDASSIDLDAAVQKTTQRRQAMISQRQQQMGAFQQCMAAETTIRWRIYGDFLEKKLKGEGGLSAEERQEWLEDIAALREAEQKGLRAPRVIDYANPNRWSSRITANENLHVSQAVGKERNELRKNCRSMMR